MDDTFVCTHCSTTFSTDQRIIWEEDPFCEDCAQELLATCSYCGRLISQAENAGDTERTLCLRCYENYFVTCNRCGRILLADDANGEIDDDCYYCTDCAYELEHNSLIHDYSYKPYPLFYGEGNRHFGVELEIDDGGRCRDHAQALLDTANRLQETLYIKSDGSLNDGLELVSHPITLDFHLHHMPWQSILQQAAELGYCSHKTDTCGLHIHISRLAFGADTNEQDNAIGRLLFFVECHWKELLRFSRRTESQLNRWAARYGYKDHPKAVLDAAKHGCSGRYACVNIWNHDTVEIRIFRGTLRYSTFAATLQLVNEICNVAVLLSDESLQRQSWSEFVAGLSEARTPELIAYLKEKRLYINEPVVAEEEA